jgi:hypothetical protein
MTLISPTGNCIAYCMGRTDHPSSLNGSAALFSSSLQPIHESLPPCHPDAVFLPGIHKDI